MHALRHGHADRPARRPCQLLAWTLVNRSLVAAAAGDMEMPVAIGEESVEARALHGVATAWFGLRVRHRATTGGEELPDLSRRDPRARPRAVDALPAGAAPARVRNPFHELDVFSRVEVARVVERADR